MKILASVTAYNSRTDPSNAREMNGSGKGTPAHSGMLNHVMRAYKSHRTFGGTLRAMAAAKCATREERRTPRFAFRICIVACCLQRAGNCVRQLLKVHFSKLPNWKTLAACEMATSSFPGG